MFYTKVKDLGILTKLQTYIPSQIVFLIIYVQHATCPFVIDNTKSSFLSEFGIKFSKSSLFFFFSFFLGNLLSLMAVKFYYGFWFFRRMWGQYWIFLFIWNLIEVFYFYFYKILIIVGQFIFLFLFGRFTMTTWLCLFFVAFHHHKLLLPFLS